MSAWEHFNGPLNYNAIPIGPAGCRLLIHIKPNIRQTWYFRGRNWYSIGPALHYYICHTVVDATTKADIISDTVEYQHSYLSQPTLTPKYRIVHALKFLSCTIHYAPATAHHNQLEAISKLRNLFRTWNPDAAADIPPPIPIHTKPLPLPSQLPRVDTTPHQTPPPPSGGDPPPRV